VEKEVVGNFMVDGFGECGRKKKVKRLTMAKANSRHAKMSLKVVEEVGCN